MDVVPLKLIFAALISFFFLGYWLFIFVDIYHLARFGVGTQPKKIAAVFLLGSAALFFVSVLFLANINFSKINETVLSFYQFS